MSKGKILIADDEHIITESMERILPRSGYQVVVCSRGEDVLSTIAQFHPEAVLLDVFMGTTNGIELLKQVRSEGWEMPVVMMTAFAEVPLAVQAMKEGAVDFVVKPFDLNHLLLLLEKTVERSRLQTKVKILQEELGDQRSRSGIIGKNSVLQRMLETATKLAQGENTTVLIEGESGTGKELVARFICQNSARAEKPFITLNCGAIPKDLAESEFFGYEKGAFTGATDKMKQGKFELADGGTILLDEVGELSLDMQVKLLRVLEEKRFYRLGGTKEIGIDVRVIAATNRDLVKEVEAGRFREDLFYRLNVATIEVPPLRNRHEDIQALAQSFLEEFAKKFSRTVPRITTEVLQLLQRLPWKGNIRELRNAIERVVLLHDVELLTAEHFNFLVSSSGHNARNHGKVTDGRNQFVLQIPEGGILMREVLKDLILKTLNITNGNQVQAAKVLGITRSKLRYRMDQLGIYPEQRGFTVSAS